MHRLRNLREIIDSRLQPFYLAVVSGAVVTVSLVLAVVLFFTSDQGQTVLGIPLGADFSGSYVAAEILNQGKPEQLYDRALHHQLYHELFPKEDERVVIPYVHPPFVAGLLRLLAWMPYPIAVAIWMAISAGLYVAGLILFLKSIPWEKRSEYWLIILLAVSFEPFLFECWLGGQLSAIAFFSYTLCFACMNRKQPLLSGMALGICFYKPTLLLITLPMLFVGRRWQMLIGMVLTGLLLATLSVLLAGWNVSIGYLNVLLSFSQSASGGDLEIRTWKYVDLNNCIRSLLVNSAVVRLLVFVIVTAIPAALLVRFWWRYDRLNEGVHRWVWAATLTWTPVLNFYVGIYDSILIVQSLLLTASAICMHSRAANPLINSGFAYLLLSIYIVPWFSQSLMFLTGVPAYTLMIMVLGSFQVGWILRTRSVHDVF